MLFILGYSSQRTKNVATMFLTCWSYTIVIYCFHKDHKNWKAGSPSGNQQRNWYVWRPLSPASNDHPHEWLLLHLCVLMRNIVLYRVAEDNLQTDRGERWMLVCAQIESNKHVSKRHLKKKPNGNASNADKWTFPLSFYEGFLCLTPSVVRTTVWTKMN